MADPTKPGWMLRFRNSSFVIFLEILSFLGILLAVGALARDAWTRNEQRISSAWLLLASTATGEGGKGTALEYLNRDKSYLPRAICGAYDLPPPLCDPPRSFARLDLSSSAEGDATIISASNLAGANFSFSRLSGVEFRDVNLAGADFTGGELRDAVLFRANIDGARFINANLAGAHFVLAGNLENVRGAEFRQANISDTLFATDLESYMGLLCQREERFSNPRLVELIGDARGAACEGASIGFGISQLGRLQVEKMWETAGVGVDLFSESWVWSGHEPVGLPEMYRTYFICDAADFPPDVAKSRFFGFPGLARCKKAR